MKCKLQTLKRREVLEVYVGMVGRHGGHVDTIQHDGNDIVGQNLPELFRDVVPAERILQGEVELGPVVII